MQEINRRAFLGAVGTAAGLAVGGMVPSNSWGDDPNGYDAEPQNNQGKKVALVCDPADKIASSEPVQWALGQLSNQLQSRGFALQRYQRINQAAVTEFCIVVAGEQADWLKEILLQANISLPQTPESLALASAGLGERTALFAVGTDARGLMYAILEISDRIAHSDPPLAAIESQKPLVEQPANAIRSIARLFTSDVEDLSWFRDKAFWRDYLSMLAAERFNRFNLTFGLGYDFTRQIRDCYFHFAYPFLFAVPGYEVKAVGLPEFDRDENLAMLRFISEAAVARGIDFQLGLWTHAYQWTDSPQANFTISGLNAENQGPYCRDALSKLLGECPAISGITIRTHGESGVAEGNYDLWKTIFDGAKGAGRKVEIDLHAKGIDHRMIDVALSTGMPVNVSPKFSAEHMGLPYHQAAIRALEMPAGSQSKESDIGINRGLFALTNGERKFMRYSYGDLLRTDRRYGVLYRMWPGTQRLLLWGDPQMAAALGRSASFGGGKGMEFCEPLSFKGRKGSGLSGGRDAYQAAPQKPTADWEKYAYTYRLWGRLLYNPDSEPQVWQRKLRKNLGAAAPAAELALSHASRILPLVTTAHLPSAANNNYWPEIYTNMSLVDSAVATPYSDTPSPKRFGTVSPLDPELFLTIEESAAELIANQFSGKYSSLDVIHWLDDLTKKAANNLKQVEQNTASDANTDSMRLIADVKIQIGLGEFFAHKFRAGLLFSLYQQGGNRTVLEKSLQEYQAAREAWADAAQSGSVYVPDVTFGMDKHLRGHWSDRLAAIDDDIARIKKLSDDHDEASSPPQKLSATDWQRIQQLLQSWLTQTPAVIVKHQPPANFQSGAEVKISLTIENSAKPSNSQLKEATLCYRRINQAESFQTSLMHPNGDDFSATIPADYTRSPHPLQYFFKLHAQDGRCWMHPGLDASLCNQPYFVVKQS